jgi:GT2 family glycosyltransferase
MSEPKIERFGKNDVPPVVSIIVLNYNGEKWLARCFESIKTQTIINTIELIFADNNSNDTSVQTARHWLAGFPAATIVLNHENLGFCAGNNVAARFARSPHLFLLNSDAWLEADCMERLLAEVRRTGAAAATPLVLNYNDDSYQDLGFFGFDIFGFPSPSSPQTHTREIFLAGGCSLLIERELFEKIGQLDPEFFMYADDTDLCWRVQIAGGNIAGVIPARVHHRGAVHANPEGGAKTTEFRTTFEKRFLTNRNSLLSLLKNCRHILLLLVLFQIGFLFVESLAMAVLLRNRAIFRQTFLCALRDCWRLRHHVIAERKRIQGFRRRGDFWMLRFFRWRLNRWFEIKRLVRFGLPRVDAR